MELKQIQDTIKKAFRTRRNLIAIVNADNDDRIYEEGKRPRPTITAITDARFHELDQLEKEFINVWLLPSKKEGNVITANSN